MMTHYYHFHQQNSPSSYHHRNKGSLIYLEQFQNHLIGIPKLMKMHLKTFEHPRTPCFREYLPPPPGIWGPDQVRVVTLLADSKNRSISCTLSTNHMAVSIQAPEILIHPVLNYTTPMPTLELLKVNQRRCISKLPGNYTSSYQGYFHLVMEAVA